MSVSTIGKFWERSSLIFKVLVVFMFMVPIGVSNFVGAASFAEDEVNDNEMIMSIDGNNDGSHIDNHSTVESQDQNDNINMTLYSVEPPYVNTVLTNK